MRHCRAFALVLLLVLSGGGDASAAEPPALAKARALYNAGNYDGAIEAAATVRSDKQFGDAAALVLARAHLERYRLDGSLADLATARDALKGVQRAALTPRDQIDLLIGLGQTLYFGDQFGAGAQLFAMALEGSELLSPRDRDLLLDWWASALDREAATRPAEQRPAFFVRIAERMEEALVAQPGSAVANYWLVAAARGQGDVERAWDNAVAAWVRARLAPETATRLRADLDRLVVEALIPERARTRPAREDPEVALLVEWERVKESWK
jgi:hypothetical protein